jgi:hypothetical protein
MYATDLDDRRGDVCMRFDQLSRLCLVEGIAWRLAPLICKEDEPMTCLPCESTATTEHPDRTELGYPRVRCRDCRRGLHERTGTPSIGGHIRPMWSVWVSCGTSGTR